MSINPTEKLQPPADKSVFEMLALATAMRESSDLHLDGPDTQHHLEMLLYDDEIVHWLVSVSFDYPLIIDQLSQLLRERRHNFTSLQKLYLAILDINAWLVPDKINPAKPASRARVKRLRSIATRASAYYHQSKRPTSPDKKDRAVALHIGAVEDLAKILGVEVTDLKWISPRTLMRIAAQCNNVLRDSNHQIMIE